ncbi:GNAT family N-acetyltransferase [Chitinimonas lacunae]|uniref:GNAT family N-acetyltransferase n=1 Tax=Chitinimonas lacunae TaxID=1963018 RepID=A0ABV8MTI7_9NEIS
MLTHLDLDNALIAAELLTLQRQAYRQEAELIGYHDLPPLHESLPELMDCGETVLGWKAEGELLGVLGYSVDSEGVLICRLAVAPQAQRQGIARRLLDAVIAAAGQQPIRVATAAANLPAIYLYCHHGFEPDREWQTPDGLALVGLVRMPA